MRQRQLLSPQPQYPRADGGVPREDLRPRVARTSISARRRRGEPDFPPDRAPRRRAFSLPRMIPPAGVLRVLFGGKTPCASPRLAGGVSAPVGGPVGRSLHPVADHPLPERLPLRGRGLLAGLPGPHRRRPGQIHHRRHRLLLVLLRNQHRARHQGPRRPLDQPEVLGLLRRALGGRVRPDRDRHRHRRREDVPQRPRQFRERGRHGGVRSRSDGARARDRRRRRALRRRPSRSRPSRIHRGSGFPSQRRVHALPGHASRLRHRRLPLSHRGRMGGQSRPNRRGPARPAHERHRLLLVLLARQRRAR